MSWAKVRKINSNLIIPLDVTLGLKSDAAGNTSGISSLFAYMKDTNNKANAGNRIQFYDTPGTFTWTIPAGVKWVRVTVCGGGEGGDGGGGSYAYTQGVYGGGSVEFYGGGHGGKGGSRGVVRHAIIDVSSISSVAITVGDGGIGGIGREGSTTTDTSAPNPGSAGGVSSFGIYLSAPGGKGNAVGGKGVIVRPTIPAAPGQTAIEGLTSTATSAFPGLQNNDIIWNTLGTRDGGIAGVNATNFTTTAWPIGGAGSGGEAGWGIDSISAIDGSGTAGAYVGGGGKAGKGYGAGGGGGAGGGNQNKANPVAGKNGGKGSRGFVLIEY